MNEKGGIGFRAVEVVWECRSAPSWISLLPLCPLCKYLTSLPRAKALLTHRTSCLQAPGELFWLISIGFRDIPLGSSVAQGLTIIRRLLPGDEDYAFHVLDVVLALFTPRFLSTVAPPTILEKGRCDAIKPFLNCAIHSNRGVYLGPAMSRWNRSCDASHFCFLARG
jgi:hypothetical protein